VATESRSPGAAASRSAGEVFDEKLLPGGRKGASEPRAGLNLEPAVDATEVSLDRASRAFSWVVSEAAVSVRRDPGAKEAI